MRVVLCNAPPHEARELARKVVEERLAACVNVLPSVTSIYEWEGAVHEETESTLVIKTAAERVDALRERIHELHSYDVPEIVVLAVDVDASHRPYVDWVRQSASPRP